MAKNNIIGSPPGHVHIIMPVPFLDKGFGQVKIKLPYRYGCSLVTEVFVAHLLASHSDKTTDIEKNIRNIQTRQLMEQVNKSTADAVIVGGQYEFNSIIFSTFNSKTLELAI